MSLRFLMICIYTFFDMACGTTNIPQENHSNPIQTQLVQKDTTNSLLHAFHFIQHDSVQQAEMIIQSYLNELQEKFDTTKYFNLYITIGDQYLENSLFAFSLKYFLEANNISNNLPPKHQIYIVTKIGSLYYDLKEFDKARKYYQLQNTIAEKYKLDDGLIASYINLGETYRFQNQPRQAMDYYNQALKLLMNKKRPMLKATAYNNIACVYLNLQQYDSAYLYFTISKELIFQLDDNEKKAAIYTSFGNYYYETGNYEEAIRNYRSTFLYDITNEVQEDIIHRDAYKGLYISYEAIKDYRNAYINYQKYTKLKKKIFNIEKQEELVLTETQLEIEKQIQKIDLLEQLSIEQNKKKKLITIIFSLVSVLLVGIVFLTLYTYKLKLRTVKQKHKLLQNQKELTEMESEKRKSENAQLIAINKELEASEIIAKLQRRHLKTELDHKKRELASQAIHISSKNQILNQIKENLKKQDFLSKNKQVINAIIHEINSNIHLDEDWKHFKIHFEETHPKFFARLKDKYSDLTNEELKLCAYLRLNLSTKEIAQLLNITPIAINKRRNRLRKKINIDPEVDLYSFIANI